MTHKIIMRLITVLILVSTFCGCPNDNETDSGTTDNNNNGAKITSLKTVIDNAAAGSTIDLSQYSDITDYDAVIDKAVTITNGSLGSGNLTVTSSGVELSGVSGSANVTTNSSLKISSSSLSSLSVASVSSLSANRILSRGKNAVTVEITNSVVSHVTMNISDSVLNVSGSETQISSIKVKVSVSIVLQNVNNDNITLPKAEDIPQGVTLTLTDNENQTTQIKGTKSDSSSSSSSESDDSSLSPSDSGDDSSAGSDDSSSLSSSYENGDSSSLSSSDSGDSSSIADPTADTVSGSISFGDDPMLYLVLINDHTGDLSGDSWTFDLTSDLGVDLSDWTITWSFNFFKGSHELGTEYGSISNPTTYVGSNTFTTKQLQAGWYNLYIEATVMPPSNLSNNTCSFTASGTFDLYVEE